MKKLQGITNTSGQLFIEAAIAASMIVIALTGIFALTSQALGLSRVISERFVAANLAQEGMELAKNWIDKNIYDIKDNDPKFWKDGFETTYTGDPDADPDFYEIDFTDGAPTFTGGPPRFLRIVPKRGAYVYEGAVCVIIDPLCISTEETRYTRRIEIAEDTTSAQTIDDKIVIHVFVNWVTRGNAQNEIHLEAHYFYWQQQF